MRKALEGVRVLDFTQLEQGPVGTMMLADFGAEVIKVERIDDGEIGRGQSPKHNGYASHWIANNRNKQSISVNLKHPSGLALVHELVKTADIVASNFRPGVMEHLGLGYDTLSRLNPRIICAYTSGYGQDGPYQDARGQDLAAQALGGIMDLTGEAGGPPTNIGTFAVDYLAGMQFAMGMMAALAARERTGRGQQVDTCLLNAAITMHHQEATAFLNSGYRYPRPPHGIAHAHNSTLYGRYVCADGLWLVLIGEFYVDDPWRRVCRALELSDQIADDERFVTIESLREHPDESYAVLKEAFSRFERADVLERLAAQDVLAVQVNDYPGVFCDPQVIHNQLILEAEHPEAGPMKFVGFPIKLSDTPAVLDRLPPTVGQHTDAVLSAAGYTPDEIAELRAAGAVGSEALSDGEPNWGRTANAV